MNLKCIVIEHMNYPKKNTPTFHGETIGLPNIHTQLTV